MTCYYGHFPFNGETGQTRISSPCINGKIWFKLLEIRKSSENGSPSKLIQTFGLDWPEVQTFCVPFNNLTVLTRLACVNGKRPMAGFVSAEIEPAALRFQYNTLTNQPAMIG